MVRCWFLFFVFFFSNLSFGQSIFNLVRTKCSPCHYKEGYAPFPLETYEQVKNHAKEIQVTVERNIMPPWKADSHVGSFTGVRALNHDEKQQLLKWLALGAPKAEWNQPKESNQLKIADSIPHLVFEMPRPFFIPASDKNLYICYKIPYTIQENQNIKGIRFYPGNKTLVHHASFQIFEIADNAKVEDSPDYFVYNEDSLNRVLDGRDFEFFKMNGAESEPPKEVYHGGWLPGNGWMHFPEGVGFTLPKKGVILIRSLHYSPSAVVASDQSKIGVLTTQNEIKRRLGFAAFQPKNPSEGYTWTIPPDSLYKAHLNVKFSQDVEITHINPHMHQLGKTFVAYAITQEKDTLHLISISNWDFNWQDFYQYQQPVIIPKGAVLHAEATYDNTRNNPNNPFYPPRAIQFETGMDERNEMMRLVLVYLTLP